MSAKPVHRSRATNAPSSMTPVTVDPGKHTVVVRKPGFESVSQSVDVPGGADVSLAVVLRSEAHGARLIVNAPASSTIGIDGQIAGTDRYEGQLPAGEHVLRVSQPGAASYDMRVELHEGGTGSTAVRRRTSGCPCSGPQSGATTGSTVCPDGCNVAPPGTPDSCY